MINIYSSEEISKIRRSGEITARTLEVLIARAVPGVTTFELDKQAESMIRDAGGTPSFMTEPGYEYTTCMNINDMVVHGIPTNYSLKKGDRLGIDLGTVFEGFHSDASWSIIVGDAGEPEFAPLRTFLESGKRALELALEACRPGKYVGDISKTIQDSVEGAGYSVVKQLVGHGVGHALHEDPEIPCYLRGKVENTAVIKPGMVFAIEIIYNAGGSPIAYLNNDGWTIVTADRSPSGLFEKTVAVTEAGIEVLTPTIAA